MRIRIVAVTAPALAATCYLRADSGLIQIGPITGFLALRNADPAEDWVVKGNDGWSGYADRTQVSP